MIKALAGSANFVEPESNEEDAHPEGEVVFEEEDDALDLGDLAGEKPHRETVRERLVRAEKRRTTRREKNWHDTPVDVTPSGRHEVIEWSGEDDIDENDVSEIVKGPGIVDTGDLDESTLGGPATVIEQQLDAAGFPAADVPESGPMTMAAYEMEGALTASGRHEVVDEEDDETDIGSIELQEVQGQGGSGPMTVAVQQMEFPPEAGTETGYGKTEGPPETALEWESNIAQDAGSEAVEGDAGYENRTGQSEGLLLDSAAQQSAHDEVEGAARPIDDEAAQGHRYAEPPYRQRDTETYSAPGRLDPGAQSENQATEQYRAEDDGAGTVSEESVPAQPREEVSQQPEVFTVGDDSGAPLGRGLDVGTANLVAARMDEEGSIEFFPARNAFLDVPEDPYTLKMLKGQGVPYIKRENKLFIIGEDAFELANIFNREMRRPMKNGLISPTDADAMPMEVELFKKILGPPRAEGEMVYYSIPADPVDSTMNIVYHTNIANGLLERLGYRGHPFNEGQAIVFSELGDDEFTGIGISCGGGMVNVCVCFRSMPVVSFSTAKGGDWIDQQAAQVMGCAASKITAVKERGVDINAPKTPEEEAIVIYYRHLIKYSLDNIVKKFAATKDIPNFPKPVPIAVSGGTSKVGGFVEVFKDEFSKLASKFPIKISDIRKAEDQLNATAKGCLLAALSHED